MRLIHATLIASSFIILALLFYTIFLSDLMSPQIRLVHQILFYLLILLFFINLTYIGFVLHRENNQMKKMQEEMKAKMEEIAHYSSSKDSFIANISHELKTPLSTILTVSYLLRNTDLTERQQDLVSKMENSSDILLSIINDVLDLSKLKFGGFDIKPVSFQLMDIIENMENMFSDQLTNRGIDWQCNYNFQPDLSLRMDKYRLSQILINLLTNASKFTDKGFISLTMEISPDPRDPDSKIHLLITVEDSGIGIPEHDIPLIFKEFEQVEHHIIKGHQGSGLGLAIVKRIVEAMGGNIKVKSAVGKGSTFSIFLPSIAIERRRIGAMQSNTLIHREEWQALPPVLVVEDMDTNGQLVQELLLEMGLKSELASDGPTAIELCREKGNNYYSLILMDIHMPVMDGYTAASILKKDLKVTCPIVAFTATAISEKNRVKYDDVLSGHILKPLKVTAFQKELTRYLGFHVDGGVQTCTEKESEPKCSMEHFGDREDLYLKYLERFKTNYRDYPSRIKDCMDSGDFVQAHRLVHSMKGMAGMLGMLPLYNISSIFEENLLNNPSEALAQYPIFEESFNSHLNM
ncbi:MAG: ATP-binding protein [Anaerovoracaceae bacterium]|jgi:signal transduction histidine kinase/CheY-like chemotaxis protein/HPt (histidine-containing phosphotransfer) domain-containing protein